MLEWLRTLWSRKLRWVLFRGKTRLDITLHDPTAEEVRAAWVRIQALQTQGWTVGRVPEISESSVRRADA